MYYDIVDDTGDITITNVIYNIIVHLLIAVKKQNIERSICLLLLQMMKLYLQDH